MTAKVVRSRSLAAALTVLLLGLAPSAVEAAPRCALKTASGTGPTEDVAKFQVYEGLLRSASDDVWLTWMATGATPGYRVAKPVYTCVKGRGLGVSCRGRTSICKA